MSTSVSSSNLNGQTPQQSAHLNNNKPFPKIVNSGPASFNKDNATNLNRSNRSDNSMITDEDIDEVQVIEPGNDEQFIHAYLPFSFLASFLISASKSSSAAPPELTSKQLEELFTTSPSIEAFAGRLLKYYFSDKELSQVNPNVPIGSGHVGKRRGGSLATLDPSRMSLIKKHITAHIDAPDKSKLWLDCVHRMQIVIHRVRKRHEMNMISRLSQHQHKWPTKF